MPERSFFLNGRQFHICARCTGIFCGFFLFPVLLPFKINFIILFIIISTIFISADGLTQLFKLRESNNSLRFITGMLYGIAFPNVFTVIIKFLFQKLHVQV
ncbi:MAG: DUF2085 domain-containing protein [Treponema sp.]|nr:DUF2085 domain-containing protein [Treponema sp.]